MKYFNSFVFSLILWPLHCASIRVQGCKANLGIIKTVSISLLNTHFRVYNASLIKVI